MSSVALKYVAPIEKPCVAPSRFDAPFPPQLCVVCENKAAPPSAISRALAVAICLPLFAVLSVVTRLVSAVGAQCRTARPARSN
jgi:hypothetical protein